MVFRNIINFPKEKKQEYIPHFFSDEDFKAYTS